jgi:polysaccharide pyruvyl transferase WcaK-like protein
MESEIMRKIKVIQLATYRGNIGDNANIVGTRNLLNQNLGFEIEYTDLDIMDFLWGLKKYDLEFIELVNQHDLLIVGGGGFFELTSDKTCTGTALDISVEVLRQIDTPIVFHALGVDIAKSVPEERLNKFRTFLDYLLASEKILVSIRNDGSMDAVRKLLGDGYAKRLYKAPDGGFFTVVEDFHHPELPTNKRVIGINLAGDMLDFRFPNINYSKPNVLGQLLKKRSSFSPREPRKLNTELFLTKFCTLMSDYLRENDDLDLVLIPHIFKDLSLISGFLNKFHTPFSRRRVTVAPYLQGQGAQEYIFDLYRKCNLVMGMRFHTNVCGIGLNVPTIGFNTYPQIGNLYRELGLSERVVRVNEDGFEERLVALINESLSNSKSIRRKQAQIRIKLLDDMNAFHKIVKNWLDPFL